MQVGFSEQRIPITKPYYLAGFTRSEKTSTVQQPLAITVMAMAINQQHFLLCMVDCVLITKDFSSEVKKELYCKYGLKKEEILIAATHTHSAPAFLTMNLPFPEYDQTYRELMKVMILRGVKDALADRECATCTMQVSTMKGIYGNRNVADRNAEHPLSLLKFWCQDRLKGIYVNMACHPTIINESINEISSDLIGGLRQELQDLFHTTVCISNGACGDISTRYYRKGTGSQEVKRCAKAIVEQLSGEDVAIQLDTIRSTHVDMQSYFDVRTYAPFLQELAALEGRSPTAEASSYDKFMLQNYHHRKRIAPFYHELESTIFQLGEVWVVSIPGELVTSLGNRLKAAFPEDILYIITYSDDYVCYLVDKVDYGTYFESKLAETPPGKADEFITSIINHIHHIKENIQ